MDVIFFSWRFFKGCVDNMHLACQAVQSKVDSSWMVYLNEYTTLQKLSLESCISITSSSLKHLIGQVLLNNLTKRLSSFFSDGSLVPMFYVDDSFNFRP